MLALTLSALALLPSPLWAPTARPAVGTRAAHVSAMADVSSAARVVGQVAESNPTESFSGKLYDGKKEVPPIWGGIRIGTRRLVVVTGASSGLGLWAAKALADKGNYFVICAVRSPAKMDQAAKEVNAPPPRALTPTHGPPWTPTHPPGQPPAMQPPPTEDAPSERAFGLVFGVHRRSASIVTIILR